MGTYEFLKAETFSRIKKSKYTALVLAKTSPRHRRKQAGRDRVQGGAARKRVGEALDVRFRASRGEQARSAFGLGANGFAPCGRSIDGLLQKLERFFAGRSYG